MNGQQRDRDIVTFKELVDRAHKRAQADGGHFSVETNLLQIPDEGNGYQTIVKARVTFTHKDGSVSFFDGIGDASPQNVTKMILPHCLRMGETRAIARALRLAVNAGDVAAEELADDDEHQPPARPAEPNRRPPAEVQHPPVSPRNGVEQPVCEQCQKPIAGHKFADGTFWNPATVAEKTRERTQHTLCYDCFKA